MSLVRLNIKGISYSQTQNGAYALILSEVDGEKKLPIVIGAFEAQSIAIALEKEIKPPRPLTHDLFKNFADRFEINIKQVIIHKLVDGVFYSSLICERDGIEGIARHRIHRSSSVRASGATIRKRPAAGPPDPPSPTKSGLRAAGVHAPSETASRMARLATAEVRMGSSLKS